MTGRPNQPVERMAAGGRCLACRALWSAATAHLFRLPAQNRQTWRMSRRTLDIPAQGTASVRAAPSAWFASVDARKANR